MKLSKADEFRLQAKKCLEQAEIAPTDLIKKRMRWMADEWLNMAFQAAVEESEAPAETKNQLRSFRDGTFFGEDWLYRRRLPDARAP